MILAVYYVVNGILLAHGFQVLTDTVKDNDGGVDGVTNDGQHAGDEGISYGNTGHCIERQDYQHIMYQRQNGTCCKTDIFEAEPDVEQHKDGST